MPKRMFLVTMAHGKPGGVMLERRKFVRFQLSAPAIFHWTDESGTPQEYVGRTRNLSRAGAFVITKVLPQVGAKCLLEVHLPPLEPGAAERWQLRTEGDVTRMEEGEFESGFAASGTFKLI